MNVLGLGLGLTHPWIHLQVRHLGREWAFEVGVVDRAKNTGVIRFSTFQVCVLSFTCYLSFISSTTKSIIRLGTFSLTRNLNPLHLASSLHTNDN